MSNGSDTLQPPPGDPSFPGSNPAAFRIDPDGSLQAGNAPLPADTTFPTGPTPVIALQPLYFNAPSFFVKQSKPIALCKLGVAQEKQLSPLSAALSWSIISSLITQKNQDLQSGPFTLSSDDISKLATIPLPGGRGKLWCTITAQVGGDTSKGIQIIESVFGALQSIAGGNATKGLITIPAAPLAAASQIEGLLQQVAKDFASPTRSQYWINSNEIELIATAAQGGPGWGVASAGGPSFTQVKLCLGTTNVVIIPTRGNAGDPNAVNAQPVEYFSNLQKCVNSPSYRFGFDPDFRITMTTGPSGASNPFDAIPYITLNAQAASTPPNTH